MKFVIFAPHHVIESFQTINHSLSRKLHSEAIYGMAQGRVGVRIIRAPIHGKKGVVVFSGPPPRRGLCWDENSKDHGGLNAQFRPDILGLKAYENLYENLSKICCWMAVTPTF
jgi:hypothetical protein